MLSNKKGRGTIIDFTGGLWAGRVGNGRDKFMKNGRDTGRDDWNWVAFQGQGRNLLQWELPGIYQDD